MPASIFTGLDPERLEDLVSVLRSQAEKLHLAHDDARTALALADIADTGILLRLADRADLFQSVAAELGQRAEMVRNYALGFSSDAAAIAAEEQIIAGLDSFNTLPELLERVDSWSGSDNDPILDDLVRRLHERKADDDAYRVLWAEWASEQTHLAEAEQIAHESLGQIQDLLRIDNQSGWTPWHDGKAEVAPEDAAEAMALLAELEPVALALLFDQLSQDELQRLADGLMGDATHASKPWGHWAWTPLQVPARETKHWMGEAGEAGAHFYTGIAEGFYAMGAGQGGPTYYNPYPADHIEDHFTESGQIILDGSIPLLSNGARCVSGDGWGCVGFGAEVTLWVAGEMVGGVIVSTVARTPAMALVKVRLRDGSERIASVINRRIRRTSDDIVPNPGTISINPLDHPLPPQFPQIPADASVRPLTPQPGKVQYGVEFVFPHPNTKQKVVIRIHGPDPSAPPGSNASSGDVLRISVGQKEMDLSGTLHPPGIYNPRSEFFNEQLINDVHIPWPVTR